MMGYTDDELAVWADEEGGWVKLVINKGIDPINDVDNPRTRWWVEQLIMNYNEHILPVLEKLPTL